MREAGAMVSYDSLKQKLCIRQETLQSKLSEKTALISIGLDGNYLYGNTSVYSIDSWVWALAGFSYGTGL